MLPGPLLQVTTDLPPQPYMHVLGGLGFRPTQIPLHMALQDAKGDTALVEFSASGVRLQLVLYPFGIVDFANCFHPWPQNNNLCQPGSCGLVGLRPPGQQLRATPTAAAGNLRERRVRLCGATGMHGLL